MKQGLFESLTGEFYDFTPIDAVPESKRQMLSIIDHLTRLFNTRSGCLSHLPDYGLPDISELYRRMPEGVDELRAAIRKTVEKYEPRLKNVKVVPRDSELKSAQIIFILSAELKSGGQVRFQTTFSTTEPSTIIPWKKPQ
jgi:type VI secretion system protein